MRRALRPSPAIIHCQSATEACSPLQPAVRLARENIGIERIAHRIGTMGSSGKGNGGKGGPREDRRDDRPINLAERRIASQVFAELFREGMELVDETATYLDGEGRNDSHALSRPALAAYAQQSMRLSTRLMQLASWLLLQRAVVEGEMSVETALRERGRIDLQGPAPDEEQEELLPAPLVALIHRSYQLQRLIAQLDAALDTPTHEPANAVAGQIGRLRSAFERH